MKNENNNILTPTPTKRPRARWDNPPAKQEPAKQEIKFSSMALGRNASKLRDTKTHGTLGPGDGHLENPVRKIGEGEVTFRNRAVYQKQIGKEFLEFKKLGIAPGAAAHSIIAKRLPEIIATFQEIMHYSPNEAMRHAAAKVLLNKLIPDVAMVKVEGEIKTNGEYTIHVIAGEGFVPPVKPLDATPAAPALPELKEVQDADMAQTGTEDDNSHLRDNKTSISA